MRALIFFFLCCGLTFAADTTNTYTTAANGDRTPSFGKIFQYDDTGIVLVVTTSGTYQPWITSEAGPGTGSTGGSTITTSTGNPSTITIGANGAGYYQVQWHAGISMEKNAQVECAIFKNGVEIDPTCNHVQSAEATKYNLAFIGSTLTALEVGDVLDLRFDSSDDGDEITLYHVSLSIFRIAVDIVAP